MSFSERWSQKRASNNDHAASHEHCFHVYRGVLFMVVPDGHVVQKCCKCEAMRTAHLNHLREAIKPRCAVDQFGAGQMAPSRPSCNKSFADLLAASSFGGVGAKAVRERAPRAAVDRIMRRVAELDAAEPRPTRSSRHL